MIGLIPHGEPPTYFTFPSLTASGVPHATTTRHFAAVGSARQATSPFRADAVLAFRETGLDVTRLAYARQVHGADAVNAPPGGGFAGRADILTTAEPGVPLAIFTADCLAITLYDRQAGALAIAHVGWRGTVRGATTAAVLALERLGASAARMIATISPSIGPCCYEVDEPVISDLSRVYPKEWDRWVIPAGPGHWMLDLWRANEDLLCGAGLFRDRIENPRVCTACQLDLFHSYRKGDRGRLVTIAALA